MAARFTTEKRRHRDYYIVSGAGKANEYFVSLRTETKRGEYRWSKT